MKYFFWILLFSSISAQAQINFNDFFKNKALRYDFLLAGDSVTVEIFPQQIKAEKYWGGSKNNLIDKFNFGTYRILVSDIETNQLIFLRGFSPLFMEWQTTVEAKHSKRAFYQSVQIPFPKKKIKLTIEQRQWGGNFKTIHSKTIDPDNYFIINESPLKFTTKEISISGKPEHCVDLVFLAEGYTRFEMDKFILDVNRMTNYLFETSPFDKHKHEFNIYAVLSPSGESGTDVPGENIYKNTVFNSSFYTFGTPRYLTSSDMKNICDAASLVPYDHIFVLVNTDRYGGGGFYNFISVASTDNILSKEVFVHEFGHEFAGLGDEYYTSSVAFENFYNLEIEPWESNLTTLVNFDSKWKNMVDKDTPIPTPRALKYEKKVGVFEGGGYCAKGVYSPMMNCRMKSIDVNYFCPVCSATIEQVIESHVK